MRLGWALALILPCAPALAEGFAARSLDPVKATELCSRQGSKVHDAHLRQHGGHEILSISNALFGSDPVPGEGDAMLMCPTVDEAGVWAMVVRSEARDEERNAVADGIVALWAAP